MRGLISLHWIGGFFDADGSVCLVRRTNKTKQGIRVGFTPYIAFSQSDHGLLKQVQKELENGTLKKRSSAGEVNKYGVKTNRDGYQVAWSGAECVRVLSVLREYSIGKKVEIDLVLDFYNRYSNYTKGYNKGGEEYERRYDEMVQEGLKCVAALRESRQHKDTRFCD